MTRKLSDSQRLKNGPSEATGAQSQVVLRAPQRWLRRLVAMLLLPLMSACSTLQFTYNQGPTLSFWWLDSYVDFSDEQSAPARNEIENWFKWHRSTQLPGYSVFLADLAAQSTRPVTPGQLCAVMTQIELRLLDAYDRAVPAMARVIRTFKPQQLDHLARRYAKADRTAFEDHVEPPAEERQAKSLKRWTENLEGFYGPLDDAQRAWLSQRLKAIPFNPQVWVEERRLWHAQIVDGLRALNRARAEQTDYEAALRAYAVMATRSPRESYRAYRARLTQAQCALLSEFHNGARPGQRQRAADKINQYVSDLRALQGAPS